MAACGGFCRRPATSGTCGDNLTWSFDSYTGALTISGTGNMPDFPYNGSPWDSCRKEIKSVTINGGVASIGNRAFRLCEGLKSVTIPVGITSIGYFAFYGCFSLTDIYYGGTEEQWNKIEIESDNEYLTGATIHFSENTSILSRTDCPEENHAVGDIIKINGLPVKEGKRFFTWSGNVSIIRSGYDSKSASPNGRTYSFIMPVGNLTLTAEYVIIGDIDGDGTVKSKDSRYFKQFMAGELSATDEQREALDINGDGKITSKDSSAFKKMMAGDFTPDK